MSTVSEVIRENKPNITPSSLRSYVSMLNGLKKKAGIEDSLIPSVIEKNETKIKDYLKDTQPKYRKTVLSALVAVLIGKPDSKVLKSFREQLLADSEVYEKEQKEQKLDGRLEDAYVGWDTILEVKRNLGDIVAPLLKQRKPLNARDKRLVQQWAIINLYTNQEPRRAQEIATLKWKNYNENDNYIDKKYNAVYNQYKTAKYLGKQTIPLHKDTAKAIKDWLRVRDNESEYVFLDSAGNPVMNSTKLGNILKDVFDPISVTVNTLRHSYIKHQLGDVDLKKLDHMAKNLGQERFTQTLSYIKKDTEEVENKNAKKILRKGK